MAVQGTVDDSDPARASTLVLFAPATSRAAVAVTRDAANTEDSLEESIIAGATTKAPSVIAVIATATGAKFAANPR
jgi:hypothetical protein